MAFLHWCAGSSCLQVIFSTNKADTIFSGMAMLHEYDASIPCEITGTPPSHIYKSRQVVWLNSHVCPKSIYLQDPRPFFRKNNDCSLFKNRSYKTTPVFNFTRFVLCSFCSLLILLFFIFFKKVVTKKSWETRPPAQNSHFCSFASPDISDFGSFRRTSRGSCNCLTTFWQLL